MSAELLKLELIGWISNLEDKSVLEKVASLKDELKNRVKDKPRLRNFDDGKHIFTYVADDF